MDHVKKVVTALSNKEAYPEEVKSVDVIHTAVSCIFLTGSHAYKINKPLNLGFLDYSSLEKRKEILYKELELNSILCPGLYKEVLPITENKGEVKLAGNGEVIEYALKMKEFPQEGILSNLLKKNKVTKEDLAKVAKKIANFHEQTPNSEEIKQYGSFEAIKELWEEIFTSTESFVDLTVNSFQFNLIKDKINKFLEENKEVFNRRAEEGRIRYNHGDFHSANICLADDVHIFDRIGFNMKFPCSDTAAEVAFLAMDLDFHNQQELSNHFIEEYIKETQDREIKHLLNFYKCFRASIRGEIACFKSEDKNISEEERQEAVKEAREYFELSEQYALIL